MGVPSVSDQRGSGRRPSRKSECVESTRQPLCTNVQALSGGRALVGGADFSDEGDGEALVEYEIGDQTRCQRAAQAG